MQYPYPSLERRSGAAIHGRAFAPEKAMLNGFFSPPATGAHPSRSTSIQVSAYATLASEAPALLLHKASQIDAGDSEVRAYIRHLRRIWLELFLRDY